MTNDRATDPPAEAEVGPNKGQRHGDAEPEGQQSHEGAERDGGTGTLDPQDQVQHEEHAKHHPATNRHDALVLQHK